MDTAQFKQFVDNAYWIFAKTYAKKAPHEYTLRKEAIDDKQFAEAVHFIRKNGYNQKFWKAVYRYFDFEGYSYWTMGAPIEETILINRMKKK